MNVNGRWAYGDWLYNAKCSRTWNFCEFFVKHFQKSQKGSLCITFYPVIWKEHWHLNLQGIHLHMGYTCLADSVLYTKLQRPLGMYIPYLYLIQSVIAMWKILIMRHRIFPESRMKKVTWNTLLFKIEWVMYIYPMTAMSNEMRYQPISVSNKIPYDK